MPVVFRESGLRILRVVSERRDLILKVWNDYFGNGGSF